MASQVAKATVLVENATNAAIGGASGEKAHRNFIQTYGSKGTAKAIAMVRPKSKGLAHGTIKVNKKPLLHFVDNILILKFQDCLSAIGADNLALMKIDIKVTGGGSVSRLYAVLQALCKGSIAYLGKYVDEDSMARLKEKLLALDKTLLIKDSRRTRPKRFGGAGANARYRKSYR